MYPVIGKIKCFKLGLLEPVAESYMGIPQGKDDLLLAFKMDEAMWKVMRAERSQQLLPARKQGP